jgi:SulP family sulfate permease
MATVRLRLAGLVPGVSLLRRYQRIWLRADVLAGVTVAAYLVPQVMAYAQVARLPAQAGLWAITGSLLVYAIFGSSRQLSVGPESTTALMTVAVVAPLAAGDPARYAALAAALGLVVGGICLIGWAARLGFLADLLSKPILVGYMAGVAVTMIVSQLGKLTGVPVNGSSFLAEMRSFMGHLDRLSTSTVTLATIVLVFLLVLSRLVPRTPVPLIGIGLATVVVAIFALDRHGIALVGDIPAGLPTLHTPAVSTGDLTSLLLPAVGVAIVAFSDNVLTARSFAARNHYTIDANQELLALGAANLTAGVVRGFPVSSSASRTVIGDALGSKSQLYSLVALASVLVTLVFLRPVLARFPTAALGAIVVYAALGLIDIAEFARIARFRRSELLIAVTTATAVLAWGVLYGLLIAVGLSILELLQRVARPHDSILGYVPEVAGMHDIDDYPDAEMVAGLVVYRYDAPLFFANAEDFKRRALASLDAAVTPVEWFVLNAEANVEVDITAVDTLEELRAELASREVVMAMARVKQDLRVKLEAAGLVDRIGHNRIFMTLPAAVEAYTRWYTERHSSPPPVRAASARPAPIDVSD